MISFPTHIRSKHLVIAGYCFALMLMLATCDFGSDDEKLTGIVHYSGKEFAGTETCAPCHNEIAADHALTPHAQTSRAANSESVEGSFEPGENIFAISERLHVAMQRRDSAMFQVAVADSQEVMRMRMDLVVGSGRKGQTYLHQDTSGAIFQLPVSYYTPGDAWTNSPGYPVDQISFGRNIQARCLECHSTFFRATSMAGEREIFDPGQAMLGVSCERCHGPAAGHVRYHRSHPGEPEGKHVINPANLSRQQRLDNCALCHSGIRENFMPSFTFLAGDNLEDFFFPAAEPDKDRPPEVHGNQYGLLSASKCFRMSAMDCSSCHDVHRRETNDLELFSNRCMNCHAPGQDHFCKQPATPGLDLTKNCIDCHMPALPSRKVFLQAPGDGAATPFLVRTHLVATYEEEVRKFLERLNQ